MTIHPLYYFLSDFLPFWTEFFARFYKTFTNTCHPLLSNADFFAVLSQSFLDFCKNFVPYYTFWTFLRLHKIKFYVFSNFYGNSSPLLFIGQLFHVLIGVFCKKIYEDPSPPTIPCPTFSRFDRLIFKISPKVKVPSRFRDGTFALFLFRFLFCHTRYGDLHTKAKGVYKDLLVAQLGVFVPAVI